MGLIVVALIFFSFEWVSPDVTALSLVLVLIFTGLLKTEQAFAGFGSDTAIMILGLLLLTTALIRTGVIDVLGTRILGLTGNSPGRMLVVITLGASTLSAFMSNTACTAFFLPVVIGLAAKANISPSKLLLPLAFSSILSSSVTLISTSTNIVVSGLMQQYGMKPMGMFELAPVGIPIALVGLAYMLTIGKKLTPDREVETGNLVDFGLRAYLSEIMILPGSNLAGKTIAQAGLGKNMDLMIVRVIRNKDEYIAPQADLKLLENDVLLVEGPTDQILRIKDTAGIQIKADVKLSDPALDPKKLGLAEVILLPRSPLLGRTLKGYGFRERYGLQVLGVNRHGQTLHRKISTVPLKMGDTLLVQGSVESLNALQEDNSFRVIGTVGENRPRRKHAPIAIGIFVLVLGLATFKVMPLPVAVILGAVLCFFTRCISPEEAYREVEWKAVILIACMLALGTAMENTGTAKYLAALMIQVLENADPIWFLTSFFVLTVVLTQPMSNQAAAVVLVPVAVQTAHQLNLDPRAFAIMIAVAASCSYLTPLEPSCLMVYGPGRYKFKDFIKVGAPLTVLIYILAILIVPRVWPLTVKTSGNQAGVVAAETK